MDPAQRGQLASLLTLAGGCFSVLAGLFFGALALVMAPFLDYPPSAPAPPPWLVLTFLGFLAVVAAAGGIVLLVCAPRLRRPLPECYKAAVGAVVGGAVCLVSGNVVSAALGIAGGALALGGSEPAAAGGPAS